MNLHEVSNKSNMAVTSSGAWYLNSSPNVGRVRGHFVKLNVLTFFAHCREVGYDFRLKVILVSSIL